MKRILGTLLSVLVVLLGTALAVLGALGIAVFGVGGSSSGPTEDLRSGAGSSAVVADLAGVSVGIPWWDVLGAPTLSAAGNEGSSVFLGTGPQAAVDQFLFGVPYDLATRDGQWQLTAVPGIETAVADPREQDFWTQRSVGRQAEIVLPVGSEPTTLVIMNADGSPGVDVRLTLGFAGERIFAYSVAAVVVGVLLIGTAVLLGVRGSRSRRNAPTPDVVDVSQTPLSSMLSTAPQDPVPASDDRPE